MTNAERVIRKSMKAWQIEEGTILVLFDKHSWGNRKVADKKEIRTGADKAMMSVTKKLIDSKELRDVNSFIRNEVQFGWVEALSVPSVFRKGTYIIRESNVDRLLTGLDERKERLEILLDKLCDVYDDQVNTAVEKLGPQFRRGDYPSREDLKRMFYWECDTIEFRVPDSLSPQARARQIARMQNMWENAAEDITYALREGFRKLVKHAAEMLEIGKDGKKRKLYDSTIEGVKEFLATFRDKNITNDSELEELVMKAQEVLTGVKDVDVLKSDLEMREVVRREFEEITRGVDMLMVNRPVRKFNFDDEG